MCMLYIFYVLTLKNDTFIVLRKVNNSAVFQVYIFIDRVTVGINM